MGDALDRLRVLLARTFVSRHQRVTAEGTIEDVEAHWRELPPSVRKTFKESMHAPTVQGGESHPFDAPDARPLKTLSPGERAAYEAVQQNVGERKLATLKEKIADPGTRSAGYGNVKSRGRQSLPSGVMQVAVTSTDLGSGKPTPVLNVDFEVGIVRSSDAAAALAEKVITDRWGPEAYISSATSTPVSRKMRNGMAWLVGTRR